MRRVRLGLLLLGMLLVVGCTVAGAIGQRRDTELDHALTAESAQRAAIVDEYFDRARDVLLLSVQNPVFTQFYRSAGTRDEKLRRAELIGPANDALAYLQTLYPGRIGEACFIDNSGAENARVVAGEAATIEDLSADEQDTPFFKPTFASPVGTVYQTRPYVSPDTGEWVIANATPVPFTEGHAIVHFEVTVDSVRQAVLPTDTRFAVQIIDRNTGQVVVDSRAPQRIGTPLGAFGGRSARSIASRPERSGVVSVGGRRMAFQRMRPSVETAGTGRTNNANDWIIAVSEPAPSQSWATPWATGPLALAAVGIVCLLAAAAGYREHHRYLSERAGTDDLTGLANRAQLRERLEAALPIAGSETVAVLLLDLDRFKIINDTLGHHAGDHVLVEVADRLRRTVEPDHLVARLGGDEFAVLIERTADAVTAERLAAKLREALHEPMTVEGIPIATSASIGIALAPQHGDSPSRILRCADIAMYHAKRTNTGYDTYRDADDDHDPARLGLEVALLAAMEQRQLELYYQPVIDATTMRVSHVEALVRWNHPQLGVIAPAEFLTLAEETGLIHQLTRYVITDALDQYLHWSAQRVRLPVAVNLSPTNCRDPKLPGDVAALLAERGLPADVLLLEVTEHAALAPHAEPVLRQLHDMGLKLTLDDFGTGYSSLSYLRSLPVDGIKLDRSFITSLAHSRADSAIISATVTMAHALGQSVTAEGVEDAVALDALRSLGVDAIQGYHICPPLPAPKLAQWLRTVNVAPNRRPRVAPYSRVSHEDF